MAKPFPKSIVGDLPDVVVDTGFIVKTNSMLESEPKGQSWQVYIEHPKRRTGNFKFFDSEGLFQTCFTYNQEEAWYEYHKAIAFFNGDFDFNLFDCTAAFDAIYEAENEVMSCPECLTTDCNGECLGHGLLGG